MSGLLPRLLQPCRLHPNGSARKGRPREFSRCMITLANTNRVGSKADLGVNTGGNVSPSPADCSGDFPALLAVGESRTDDGIVPARSSFWQAGKFAAVGVANTVLDFAIYNLLTSGLFGWPRIPANLVSI